MFSPQGETRVDAITDTIQLTDTDRIDRLRLIRSDNVGPRGIMAQTPPGSDEDPGRLRHFRISRP
jgi:DprA/Smf-like nucleotide binding protein involved in DNA uptake